MLAWFVRRTCLVRCTVICFGLFGLFGGYLTSDTLMYCRLRASDLKFIAVVYLSAGTVLAQTNNRINHERKKKETTIAKRERNIATEIYNIKILHIKEYVYIYK